MRVGGQSHALVVSHPGKRPGRHFRGRWEGLKAGLDGCGKCLPTGIRCPDRLTVASRYTDWTIPTHVFLSLECVRQQFCENLFFPKWPKYVLISSWSFWQWFVLHFQINKCHMLKLSPYYFYWGTRGGAVCWGTALQTGRSRDRFPMVSLEFFIDIILPASNRNEY
jgi:hypothetical protein